MDPTFKKKRVARELRELQNDKMSSGSIQLEMAADSLMELKGYIMGPQGTPYEGGRFQLEIKLPASYPFKPPMVRFETKVWHPNVSSVTGALCMDILKDRWTATMTMRTVLLSIQSLLSDPEPDEPQDAVVARQYRDTPPVFARTARHWAHVYAGAGHDQPECTAMIRRLVDIGIDEEVARVALSNCNWDLVRATQHIFD